MRKSLVAVSLSAALCLAPIQTYADRKSVV